MTMGLMRYARTAAILATGAMTLLTAGCGGSSTSSGVVNVRTIDDVSNSVNATIEINNGSVAGSQTYFSITPYHYLQPENCTFTISLGSSPLTYPTAIMYLAGSAFYSVYGIGNATATNPTAQGYPEDVVLQDDTVGTSSSNVELRFLAAAPDANVTGVTINSTTVGSGAIAWGTCTPYAIYTGTSVTVTVAGSGGTLLTKQLALNGGHSYTLLMDEPSIASSAPYSYSIEVVQDH